MAAGRHRLLMWVGLGAIVASCMGCVSSHRAVYTVRAAAPDTISEGDLAAMERVGRDVGEKFSMRRRPALSSPESIRQRAESGYRSLFSYFLEGGTELNASASIAGDSAWIILLQLGQPKETKLGGAIRRRLEESLKREFPDRKIDAVIGSMDTSFAP